jgi:hypothetical protein
MEDKGPEVKKSWQFPVFSFQFSVFSLQIWAAGLAGRGQNGEHR